MSVTFKKNNQKHLFRKSFYKLPYRVTKQLEKIYFQSVKNIKKRPYKITTGLLLSAGLASSIYFLIRYYRTK